MVEMKDNPLGELFIKIYPESLDDTNELLCRYRMLADDNARLRTLIKETEWSGESGGCAVCPFCSGVTTGTGTVSDGHNECRAFNPDGTVK